jgi:multisubunit Na+/H+ antiporter MnhB subunit
MIPFILAASAVTLTLAYVYGKMSDQDKDTENPARSAMSLLGLIFTFVSVLFLGFAAWYSIQNQTVTTIYSYQAVNETSYDAYKNVTGNVTKNLLANTTVTTGYTAFQSATEGWISMLSLLIWLPVFLLMLFMTMYSLVWLYNWYKESRKPKSILEEVPRL